MGRSPSDDARRSPAPAADRVPDDARQLSRSRLPLPPVPAATRTPVPAGARTPAAPRTSDAPFRAVPSPEPLPEFDREDAFPPASASVFRTSAPAPRVPRQTTPSGSPAPAYGDWTKPSRDSALVTDPEPVSYGSTPVAVAPGTTVIPERRVSRGRGAVDPYEAGSYDEDAYDDEADDYEADGYVADDFDAAAYDVDSFDEDVRPAAVHGPGTGPVGGRAAIRAERQAADMARRKANKQKGSAVAVLEEDEPRKPRRVVKGLVAMTVVALGVLGVYSFVSPETAETSAQSPALTSPGPAAAAPVDPLPELPSTPVEVEPVVTTPVKAPVTVLNATEINGLAAKIATSLNGGGWETPGVGGYTAGDVAASTVFFTEGDENQRLAALSLIEAFPQLQGPAPRFFELPADVTAPGLVVVLTGDWQP
jgi:LytR cell envelope-related transcriptional attenuator